MASKHTTSRKSGTHKRTRYPEPARVLPFPFSAQSGLVERMADRFARALLSHQIHELRHGPEELGRLDHPDIRKELEWQFRSWLFCYIDPLIENGYEDPASTAQYIKLTVAIEHEARQLYSDPKWREPIARGMIAVRDIRDRRGAEDPDGLPF